MSAALRLILPLLILVPAGPDAWAAKPLTPYRAEYKVRISILSGRLMTEFRRMDGGYMARSVIEPAGLANVLFNGTIEESSRFLAEDRGVVPEHYRSVDTITSDNKVMNFEFDWERREIAGTINEESYVIPLDGVVHDRVSIQFELMHNLLNDIRSSHYTLLNDEELRPIVVSTIGTKKVKVPYGEFEAVGIQHSTEGKSRVSTLWCVESLGYLPVIIEQYRDGKLRVRAELRDYQALTETASR